MINKILKSLGSYFKISFHTKSKLYFNFKDRLFYDKSLIERNIKEIKNTKKEFLKSNISVINKYFPTPNCIRIDNVLGEIISTNIIDGIYQTKYLYSKIKNIIIEKFDYSDNL